MNANQLKANDKYHLGMIKMKSKMYMWMEKGNIYDCSSGRSIKPATMKGFVELVGISSKDFARVFISLPDVVEIGGIKATGDFDKEKLLEQVWSCM
tara:strand:- start:1513 stop:1800 length:288 start_codon:yes stop_codon:yes gene_type:complete